MKGVVRCGALAALLVPLPVAQEAQPPQAVGALIKQLELEDRRHDAIEQHRQPQITE